MNVRSDTANDAWDVCLEKFIHSPNLLGKRVSSSDSVKESLGEYNSKRAHRKTKRKMIGVLSFHAHKGTWITFVGTLTNFAFSTTASLARN